LSKKESSTLRPTVSLKKCFVKAEGEEEEEEEEEETEEMKAEKLKEKPQKTRPKKAAGERPSPPPRVYSFFSDAPWGASEPFGRTVRIGNLMKNKKYIFPSCLKLINSIVIK